MNVQGHRLVYFRDDDQFLLVVTDGFVASLLRDHTRHIWVGQVIHYEGTLRVDAFDEDRDEVVNRMMSVFDYIREQNAMLN